ncbi:hypothetical protein [Methanobrevibacter sp. DSM 116169]|uniref:hypothetical protein n=1 Tax=Methanobrevibacter sp. DSM 116169 TaxID=3242727 RepID=UPI0038FC3458
MITIKKNYQNYLCNLTDEIFKHPNTNVHLKINELVYQDLKVLQSLIREQTNNPLTLNKLVNNILKSFLMGIENEDDVTSFIEFIKGSI